MCYPVRCGRCSKVTWGGCGSHVAEALAGFPEAELCHCNDAAGGGGSGFSGMAAFAANDFAALFRSGGAR